MTSADESEASEHDEETPEERAQRLERISDILFGSAKMTTADGKTWGDLQHESGRSSCETPLGQVTWEGVLTETTPITMPDGRTIPFYSLISHTNGECLRWMSRFL